MRLRQLLLDLVVLATLLLVAAAGAIFILDDGSAMFQDQPTRIAPPRRPPNAHIVYLVINDGIPPNSPKAAWRYRQFLGAEAVDSWEAVLALEDERPINALIVDRPALTLIDQAWVERAYWRGGVMTFFDLMPSDVAELVDDPCIASGSFDSNAYPGAFYVLVARPATTGSAQRLARLVEQARETCRTGTPQERAAAQTDGALFGLNDANDFNILAGLLVERLGGAVE